MRDERHSLLIGIGAGAAVGLLLLAGVVRLVRAGQLAPARPEAAARPSLLRPAPAGNPGTGMPHRNSAGAADGRDLTAPKPQTAKRLSPGPRAPKQEIIAPVASTLEDRISALVRDAEERGVSERIGVYATWEDPNCPLTSIRAEESFPAASVIKVPVMLALEAAWDGRQLEREPRHEQCLQRMIQHSDNEDTNRLIDLLGRDAVNKAVHDSLGAERTTTVLVRKLSSAAPGPPRNRTSPREAALLLCEISRRDRQGEASGREMMGFLRGTSPSHRTRIPQGVPRRYRMLVANKTGTLARVVNDAAIVETPRGERFILCILMDGVGCRAAAEHFCSNVARECWRQIAGSQTAWAKKRKGEP